METVAIPCVPIPVDLGYCTACRRDVALDARGRCPADGVLAIWPEGRPRPAFDTEATLKLNEATRLNPDSQQGRRAQPKNRRQQIRAANGGGPRTAPERRPDGLPNVASSRPRPNATVRAARQCGSSEDRGTASGMARQLGPRALSTAAYSKAPDCG